MIQNTTPPANGDMLRDFFSNVDKVVSGLDGDEPLVPPAADAVASEKPVGDQEAAKADGKPEEKDGDKLHADKAKDEKPEVKAPLAKGLAKLAAEQAALEKARKEFEEERRAFQAERGKPAVPPDAAALALQLRRSPLEALKALGFDDSEAANVLRAGMADLMGDKAPEAYRKLKGEIGLEARFRELEAQNLSLRNEIRQREEAAQKAAQERAAAEQQTALVTQYQNDVRKYLGGDGSKDAPLVSRLFEADAEMIMSELFEVVMQDAQAKIAAGRTDAAPLTPAEAAKVLEARHAKRRDLYGSTSQGPARTPPGLTGASRTVAANPPPKANEDFDLDASLNRALNSWGLK